MSAKVFSKILLSTLLLSQISFGSSEIKNQDSSVLIQQAKQIRISIREHLKSIGRRLNMTQVMSLSGSFSGLFANGSVSGQGFEILKETEWYYLETMNPINIEAIEARLNALVNEYRSSVSGERSIPSREVSDCAKNAFAELKKIKSTAATTESVIDLKNRVLSFSQILQELEIRTLSLAQKESLNELVKWGTTTVMVNRDYRVTNIQLGDRYDILIGNGGYLTINGVHFGPLACNSLQSTSVVTPTVLY